MNWNGIYTVRTDPSIAVDLASTRPTATEETRKSAAGNIYNQGPADRPAAASAILHALDILARRAAAPPARTVEKIYLNCLSVKKK